MNSCVKQIAWASSVDLMDVEGSVAPVLMGKAVPSNFSVKRMDVNPNVGTKSAETMAAGACAESVWEMDFEMLESV